jgi:hypothetical protein
MSAVVICGCCGIRYSAMSPSCAVCRTPRPTSYRGRPAVPVPLSLWLTAACVGAAVYVLMPLLGRLFP